MPLLSVDNVSINFGDRELLNEVSFRINEGDKIAFIGNNGTGKSTLFRIIRGSLTPTSGQVIKHGNTVIGFLSQNMEEQDFNGQSLRPRGLIEAEADLKNAETLVSQAHNDGTDEFALRKIMDDYSKILARYEAMGGYDYEYRLQTALAGLGLTGIDESRDLMTLSGGEKMRVCLAQLIVSRPDILMLDEPTNHLDTEAIEWLENFLKSYGGAVFVISHDRHFIDAVANRVIELNSGSVREYKGNYSDYKFQKAEFMKTQEAAVANLEAELAHQLDVKQTMLSHRNISGYHQREKMVNKLQDILAAERAKLDHDPMRMSFSLVPEERSGADDKILLQVKGVSKHFPDKVLFEDINFELKACDKIFLCGPNGCGKTTLLTMLLGRQGGFDGTVFISASAECGYMGQFVPFDDETITAYDELLNRSDLSETQIRSLLARFGFRGDDVYKTINVLSGGERSRLYLCCLLQEKPDILFLDEPTNHLDIESREVLEDALRDYNGAIICVSHDRYFIEKCSDKILGFKGGTANIYDSYQLYRKSLLTAPASSSAAPSSAFASSDASDNAGEASSAESSEKTSRETSAKITSRNKAAERRETAKRRERIRAIETEISDLESAQAELESSFGVSASASDYEIYAENGTKIEALYEEYEVLLSEEEES